MNNDSVVQTFMGEYEDFIFPKGDPRVADWPLMTSPWYTVGLSLAYVYTVTKAGPQFMKNRDPIHPKNCILLYNAAQVVFSLWIFIEMGMSGWFTGYNYLCQPIDYTNTDRNIRMLHACWWFFFSKFTEFFDTIFFVLRKKDQHVSFLHVIHHAIMPITIWMLVKWTPNGHNTFTALINPLVHFVMYTYYFICALGPQYEKYVWWKKYLTTFQMVQFIMTFIHSSLLFFTDCNYPKYTSWGVIFLSVLFFTLFMDFYIKDRMRQKQKIKTANGSLHNRFIENMCMGETRPKAE